MANRHFTNSSHLCVYFDRENSYQVIADPNGKFKNAKSLNCQDPENGKYRIGVIKYRGILYFKEYMLKL